MDWIYRDLDRVRKSWDDAQAGLCDFHFQIGHPLGVPDFMYAGEVALGVVLADPSGQITALQQAARRYPPRLRDALIAGLWEASFDIDIARKAVTRGDTAYVAGCLFRVVEVCALALHGHAGHRLISYPLTPGAHGTKVSTPDPRPVSRGVLMTGFAQLIEWKTSRLDEVEKLNDEWRERFPAMGPSRILICADKDNAGSYMTMVEFSSYGEAMENSKDPATSEFAEKMGALCDGPPIFHNLDIVRVENRS